MYKLCTLYSGSSGNSVFVGNEKEGVLVDIGKNAKQSTLALEKAGLTPEAVKAVFITHEHSDHISGLRVFCSRHNIPVYASLGTLEALDRMGCLRGDFPVYQILDTADIGDFHIQCFHTSHDCAEGMGYSITLPDGRRASVSTDLGYASDEVLTSITGSNIVLLESNHDINMLRNGPYPYPLKQRILSDRGHLSNDSAAEVCVKLLESGTRQIILGHLSNENNRPELAYKTSESRLEQAGANESDLRLSVALRHEPVIAEVV